MSVEKLEQEESLISDASLSLALSPPRFPPYYTAHRSLYTNKDPSHHTEMALHHDDHYHHIHRSKALHPTKKKYNKSVHDILVKVHSISSKKRIDHPHLSFSPESADQITRCISSHVLPLWLQNKYRDNGIFRSISDTLVTMSIPSLAILNPSAAKRFLSLTRKHMIRIPYGSLNKELQVIDLYLPHCANNDDINGLIFFVVSTVHGISMMFLLCTY